MQILLDDNEINRLIATATLEQSGYSVVSACDGAEAVSAFKARSFDAVLMDIQMPVMDGFEASAAIRHIEAAMGTRTPIVAVTAYDSNECRKRCIAVGMDDFLAKPYTLTELVTSIMEPLSGAERVR